MESIVHSHGRDITESLKPVPVLDRRSNSEIDDKLRVLPEVHDVPLIA